MAIYEFKLPDIGEGIAEAEIVAWHIKVGDQVSEDQPIADLMTDKATVEMEAPVAGTILRLAGEVGDQIAIGSVFVMIETSEESANGPTNGNTDNELEVTAEEEPTVAAEHPRDLGEGDDAGAAVSSAEVHEEDNPPLPNFSQSSSQVLASPTVRDRARKLGIDLADVQATGYRVRHPDLDAYIVYNRAQGFHPAGARRPDEEIKIVGMRRRIAENMSASKRHIPHFTYVEEIDVTSLEVLRAELNANRGQRPKLTLLPLLIVAICKALPDFPMINARFDDEAGIVTRHGAVHLGMAAQTEAGLMVPVIRNAQELNVWQLASEITRLAEAARSGKAKSEDLTGSTLTLTSLGPLGGIVTTPVINRPEVAIIAPNKIFERPALTENALGGRDIRLAKLMNLSMSCDHRVVDGYDAASFVQALKKLLETPILLFADRD